jgi:SAM-dependent methyltransferase
MRTAQPFEVEPVAELYDCFPFDADVPLYTEVALESGGRVLELACGTGRVLLPLLRAGARVVGVDASPSMLRIARRKLAAEPRNVAERAHLVEGDMRRFDVDSLDAQNAFDFALIAVKSFAYLQTPEDQLACLRTIHRHLRPGGRLAIDLLHPTPAWLGEPVGSLHQDLCQAVSDGGLVHRIESVAALDLAAQVKVIRSMYELIAADGTVRKRVVEWPFRYTYRYEAQYLLERAGFVVEDVYGGYDRRPFAGDDRAMVFVARRDA